ncbi:MAG TPA: WbqC family protein, partial [Puia sp.]
MNLIIDSQYFATINLYKISNNFSHIIFEQCEYYQKMSFRNRCQIAGAEGIINLSVPLEKGRDQKTLMKDVRIAATQPWQAQHWKTIVSCYNRSPWFEHYRDDLEGLYKTRYDFLVDWNLACYEWTVKALRLPVQVSLTEEYRKVYTPGEGED